MTGRSNHQPLLNAARESTYVGTAFVNDVTNVRSCLHLFMARCMLASGAHQHKPRQAHTARLIYTVETKHNPQILARVSLYTAYRVSRPRPRHRRVASCLQTPPPASKPDLLVIQMHGIFFETWDMSPHPEQGPCSAQSHLCGHNIDDKLCPMHEYDPQTPRLRKHVGMSSYSKAECEVRCYCLIADDGFT